MTHFRLSTPMVVFACLVRPSLSILFEKGPGLVVPASRDVLRARVYEEGATLWTNESLFPCQNAAPL
jgi:hypothetical protein